MEKKSDSNKKQQRREDYKKSYSGDLASFTGMYGDSFYHKIDLLGQLIHDTHHPSLGLYKEKLLKEAIEKYIPKKYEIGTGFVVFPDLVPEMVSDKWIFKHKTSTQLDIIIYDSFEYPPIFKDNDFVVLRPESVRVIIEVKGSLDSSQLESSLEKFWDYSDKWSACQGNYMSSRIHDVTLPPPIFLMMAWRKSVDTGGRLRINGKNARKKIVSFYKKKLEQRHILNSILPHLEGLMIYDDCIVEPGYSYTDEIGPKNRSKFYGYYTIQGKYRNLNEKGDLIFVGDKTIGHLLNKIYKALALDKNPSFEYIEHISNSKGLSHEHEGFDSIFEDTEVSSFVSNYMYR